MTRSILVLSVAGVVALQASPLSAAPAAKLQPAVQKFLRLPLAFEREGNGPNPRFLARGRSYAVELDNGRATVGLTGTQPGNREAVSFTFTGSRPGKVEPGPQLPGKVNYYLGKDPSHWRIGLPTWESVKYPDVYPGIDVVYYGNQQQLEFDLVVRAGADPRAIRMKIAGGKKVSLDGSGALRIETGGSGDLQINLPRIYQEVDGEKRSVVVNSIFGKPLHRNLQKTGPVEDARWNRIPSFGPASSADLRPFSWS